MPAGLLHPAGPALDRRVEVPVPRVAADCGVLRRAVEDHRRHANGGAQVHDATDVRDEEIAAPEHARRAPVADVAVVVRSREEGTLVAAAHLQDTPGDLCQKLAQLAPLVQRIYLVEFDPAIFVDYKNCAVASSLERLLFS